MGPQLAVSPLTTTCSTMAGVCCGPTTVGDGCMRHSTPSAAASAVEMETRCSSDDGTLREDLVVRVRDVVLGGLELTLTISDAIGEKTPAVLSGYCGAGGTDEGVRRAGAVSHGIDLSVQRDFSARFGEEHFTQGDTRDERVWLEAEKMCRPFLRAASPPCQPFSTGRLGEPS